MEIKSNVLTRLKKIHEGKTFSDQLSVISEMFQNSYRAKATKIEIKLTQESLIFKDNGCGCNNPENILTMDLSSWKSTKEGFGVGLFSFLALGNVKLVEICSKNWILIIDIEKIFKEENPIVEYHTSNEFLNGFQVKIESDVFATLYDSAYNRIYEDGSLQEIDTYINGELINKRDIHNEVTGLLVKKYNTHQFKGTFGISNKSTVYLFYERRFVQEIYQPGVYGVIEIKKDALTLQEPDRKNIVYNDKRKKFINKVEECVANLYAEFVKEANENEIDYYQTYIDDYLDVKDYEDYLLIDADSFVENNKEKNNDDIEDIAITSTDDNQNTLLEKNESHDQIRQKIERIETVQTISVTKNIVYKESLKNVLKKNKKAVWVNVNDIQNYRDLISKLQYYGLIVYIARNRLYERVFQKRKIPYISDVEKNLTQKFIKKDVYLKTKKEENFISLLYPIVKHYNLFEHTFNIAELIMHIEFRYEGKLLYKEIVKNNSQNNDAISGLCDGYNILLDRKALNLKQYKLNKPYFSNRKINIDEIKAIMNNLDVISHELSHLLYNAVDNTIEHYVYQEKIRKDIRNIYFNPL